MNKIRHVFATIVGLMGLSACHQDSPKQQSDFVPITKMQSNDARNAIEELIGEEGQSIFIWLASALVV